jgi:histidinol-phosphatase (PHP family)
MKRGLLLLLFIGALATACDPDWALFPGNEGSAYIVNKTDADIIGHFDLITKFNEKSPRFDESEPRYRKAAIDAVDSLLTYCRPFEVNTGAISRGYRTTPYPSRGLLEYINARGGCVILSSDSHRADTLNFVFKDALDIVRSVGFTPDRIYNDPFGTK